MGSVCSNDEIKPVEKAPQKKIAAKENATKDKTIIIKPSSIEQDAGHGRLPE